MLMRLVVLSLVLGFGVHPQAQNATIKDDIRSAYTGYFDALRQKDVAGAMKFVSRDFSGRLPDGTVVDFAGWAENLRETTLFVGAIGNPRIDIEDIQTGPSETVVTVRLVDYYSTAADPAAKPDSFWDDHLQDTWIKTAEGWKKKGSVYLRNTINGNLIHPQAETPPQSPRLAALAKEWNAGNKGRLDAFWKSVEGKTPLVEDIDGDKENLFVTFLWRGNTQTAKVLLQGGLPTGAKPLSRLADTDIWYLTERMPKDTRGTYGFIFDGTVPGPEKEQWAASLTAPDPSNPRAFSWGSVFELPNAPAQPYIKEQPGVPKGILNKLNIKSAILNEERDYGVYTPAGFNRKGSPYPLLVVFDGEDFGNGADNSIPTPTILDNLIALKKIPPTILLMVNSTRQSWRNKDLTCSRPFSDFLATELLPEVQKKYNVSTDPARIIVAGSSFGGLAAACAGLMHPESFGNVISLSGSYWFVPEWEKMHHTLYLADSGLVMQEYATRPTLPLRFYLVVGRFEPAADQLATNRHLRDILILKGYPVIYSEYDGGHDALCWRGSVADGLIALLGKNPH